MALLAKEQVQSIFSKLTYSNLTDVMAAIEQKDLIVIVAFGTDWCMPSTKMIKVVSMQGLKHATTKNVKVKVFAINQEENAEFCKKVGIIAGCPVVMVYIGRVSCEFERSGWPDSPKLVAPLNKWQADALVSAAVAAQTSGTYRLSADEILKP